MNKSIIPKIDDSNIEQKMAFDLIAKTNKCLFITGKAGTGKTTFIRRIQEEIDKNFIVLAPTGIAALAAGGQTVHSFFGFPMDSIGPHTQFQIASKNELMLKYADAIIVDEVSMLRCDMVDGMDRYLRNAFNNNMPFGGKQIIFVGDLFQLPPVVRAGSADADLIKDFYGDGIPFFYKAKVLNRMNLPKIEFQKVYRQEEEVFVNLLNNMRVGEISEEDLDILNARVKKDEDLEDYSVILTAYNKRAEFINMSKLNALDGDEVVYKGTVKDKFKTSDCQAPEYLKLKVGAQVIFCRNDHTNNCANGTIAKVTELTHDYITVQTENGNKVRVVRARWESYERTYNKESRKIEAVSIGSYTQFPLKLAWAITIHRSQGMTFDRMHFDLTWGTFAPGQAYVAISRMRSLEGLTFSNKLRPHHVTVNPEIKAFANSFNDAKMISDELASGTEINRFLRKKDYNNAVLSSLRMTLSKIRMKDYRNAALMAKQMYDIMLDDEYLIGQTDNVPVLKETNMTCNFLNSIICLYGHRYDEAIGYAELVLARKCCLEAMFVKARAYYEKEEWREVSDILFQITSISTQGEEKKAIDKKLYLLEAKVNEKIGNPNIGVCKKLIKICPNCMNAYSYMRNELINADCPILEEELSDSSLMNSFWDKTVDSQSFIRILNGIGLASDEFKRFKKALLKLAS